RFPTPFLQIRLNLALEQQRLRIALAVHRDAGDDADPALADAILPHIGLLDSVEPDADAALQQSLVVVRALRVLAQAIGKRVGHGGLVGRASPAPALA